MVWAARFDEGDPFHKYRGSGFRDWRQLERGRELGVEDTVCGDAIFSRTWRSSGEVGGGRMGWIIARDEDSIGWAGCGMAGVQVAAMPVKIKTGRR
jgi:hypothetical protein